MINASQSKEIGITLTGVLRQFPDRILIRQSTNNGSIFSACSVEYNGPATTCFEQLKTVSNCGDCTLCRVSRRPVRFLDHGRKALSNRTKNRVNMGLPVYNNTQNPCDVPEHISLLKRGNDKTGDNTSTDLWKDYKILSLTLEERVTCPNTCIHWEDCYGNNMFRSVRYSTNGLIDRLHKDIAKLNPKKKYAIRLHILGDFWSVEYVNFWRYVLETYPNINIFGFTAHEIDNSHLERNISKKGIDTGAKM